jgi:hypothetical protein
MRCAVRRDADNVIERWREAVGMVLRDYGKWGGKEWIESADEVLDAYNELLRKHNKLVDM